MSRVRGMVVGMATRKVTVTLDEGQLERIRALVNQGASSSCQASFSTRWASPSTTSPGGAPCWPTLSSAQWGDCLARNEVGGQPPRCHQPHREPCRLVAGMTLDAGGLIALERNDRRLLVLLARAQETGARVTVPATALAQAIRQPEAAGPTFSIGPSTKYGRGCARPSGRHERRSAAGSQRKDSHRRCSRRDLRQTGRANWLLLPMPTTFERSIHQSRSLRSERQLLLLRARQGRH